MGLRLPPDFKEFLSLLDAGKVEYLLVGGFAVAYHGHPRPTGDMDIWLAMTPANADRVLSVLSAFGFGAVGATRDMFLSPDAIVRMGVPPVRIEVMTTISGVEFAECYARRVTSIEDGVPVSIISREDLLRNKRAAGRHKDREDVVQIESKRQP